MELYDRAMERCQPTVLSLFRFMTGLLLLQYGIAKWSKNPTHNVSGADHTLASLRESNLTLAINPYQPHPCLQQ